MLDKTVLVNSMEGVCDRLEECQVLENGGRESFNLIYPGGMKSPAAADVVRSGHH